MLNRNWGLYRFAYTSSPLAFQGYDSQGRPTFQYQYASAPSRTTAGVVTPAQNLSTTFRNDVTTLNSRWQMQLGIRYIFN
jgi:hypothetical protein